MKKASALSRFFPMLLLLILMAAAVWSWAGAADPIVWRAEMTSVWLPLLVLAATFRLFRFSNISYAFIALWALLHTIGARYTFELVPFDFVTDLFGFQRNHFDRVAHFCIGLSAFAVAELMWRKRFVSSVRVAAVCGVLAIMAVANAWELIEWGYAVWDGGDAGLAFLGSQGDVWDAQKDMFMDTLGALLAATFFLCKGWRLIPAPPADGGTGTEHA